MHLHLVMWAHSTSLGTIEWRMIQKFKIGFEVVSKIEKTGQKKPLNVHFRKHQKKVEKKVVGFLKEESLVFKATYFIVCFGKKCCHADALEFFFPKKNDEINRYCWKLFNARCPHSLHRCSSIIRARVGQ